MIRVVLPHHLRTLAAVDGEMVMDLPGAVSLRSVLDELEAQKPALRGTMRDPATGRRRAFIRFFACEEDLSHDPVDEVLPDAVLSGREPLYVVGAMAGG
jgi:hypothetical protein